MSHAGRRLAPGACALLVAWGTLGPAGASPEIRVLRVKAVADEAFRENEGWEAEIREHLSWSDGKLRGLAGIGLELVAVEPWTTHQSSAMGLLLDELAAGVPKGGAEVVIGFTGHPPPAAMTFLPGSPKRFPMPFTAGIALPLGDRAVVRRTDWDELTRRTLIHELAHLFGGLHVAEESLLRTATDEMSFRLDPFNRRVLDLTRDRDFDVGIRQAPPEALAALVDLYREAPLRGERDPDTVIRVAYLLLLAGEVEEALEKLQAAAAIAPAQTGDIARHAFVPELEARAEGQAPTARSRHSLARAYSLAERWSEAAALLQPGCDPPEEDASSCALLGAAYLRSGRLDLAEAALRTALRHDDSLTEVHRTLGRVHSAAGRPREALESFGRALELDPADADTHFDTGLSSLAAGKPGAAEASFREVLRLREDDDDARARLAVAVARQGKGGEARALVEPLQRRRSLSAFVLRDMAEVYALSGDTEKAFAMLQLAKKGGIDVQAVEALIQEGARQPPAVELVDLLEQAEAYYRTGRYDTARGLLGRALEKESRGPRVHYWLGRVAAAEGDQEGAREHLRLSVENDPGFLPSRYELGRLAYGDKDYAGVVSWLEPYVASGEAGSGAHFMLGRSHFELGRLPEAEEHLRAAIRERPDYGDSFYFLARVYLEEGRHAEARRELELAVDSPSLPGWRREDAHLRLARLLEASGEGATAERHVSAALALGAAQAASESAVAPAPPAADRIELVHVAPSLASPLPRGQQVLVECTVRFELGTAERGTVFLTPQDETGNTLVRTQPRARVERGRGEVTLRALITTPTSGGALEVFLALHGDEQRATTAVARARYTLE